MKVLLSYPLLVVPSMLRIISRLFVLDVQKDTLVCDNPLSLQFNFSFYISLVLLCFSFGGSCYVGEGGWWSTVDACIGKEAWGG